MKHCTRKDGQFALHKQKSAFDQVEKQSNNTPTSSPFSPSGPRFPLLPYKTNTFNNIINIIIYNVTEILPVLSLADKSVKMRVYKHGCDTLDLCNTSFSVFTCSLILISRIGRILKSYINSQLHLGSAQLSQILPTPSCLDEAIYVNT